MVLRGMTTAGVAAVSLVVGGLAAGLGRLAGGTAGQAGTPSLPPAAAPVPTATVGPSRSRRPVAAKMELAAAGATAISGASPAPAGAMSGRSTSTTSTWKTLEILNSPGGYPVRRATSRADRGHVDEQVVGHQGDGQVHEHEDGDRVAGCAAVQDVKVGEPQEQCDQDGRAEEQPPGADETRVTMGHAAQAMITPITVSLA